MGEDDATVVVVVGAMVVVVGATVVVVVDAMVVVVVDAMVVVVDAMVVVVVVGGVGIVGGFTLTVAVWVWADSGLVIHKSFLELLSCPDGANSTLRLYEHTNAPVESAVTCGSVPLVTVGGVLGKDPVPSSTT